MAPYGINSRAVSWLPPDQVEEQALDQVRNVPATPFVFWRVAVMPDCHFGLGATVGSRILTKGVVVGADIGCGRNIWQS